MKTKFNGKATKRITEARKPRASSGGQRKGLTQQQRQQAAYYLNGGKSDTVPF